MSLRVAKCWGEFCVGREHGRKEPDKHPADLYKFTGDLVKQKAKRLFHCAICREKRLKF